MEFKIHTRLPLTYVLPEDLGFGRHDSEIEDTIGDIYGTIHANSISEVAARADFVVAACNSYHPLVSALRAVLPDLALHASLHGPGPDRRLAAVRNALAVADGDLNGGKQWDPGDSLG